MTKLSLLICTHNNAELLKVTLHAISQQTGVSDDWEVVVVDNNCTDDTRTVCESFRVEGLIPELRIVSESRQGTGFARKTGIRISRGEWIAFIDDDCRIADDWIATALEFVDSHPRAGVVGGRNLLEWEIEPSELLLAYGESFARQDWGDEVRQAFAHCRELPCGAGMLIRRSAVLESGYVDSGRLAGRDPVRLGAGEDTEIALFIAIRGWEVWYSPHLQLRHYIPAQRMTLHYMNHLHAGFGRAEAYLRCLSAENGFQFSNRVRQLLIALQELIVLLGRFPLGFVWYENERPTWCIRWYYTLGLIRGAIDNLFRKEKVNQVRKRATNDFHNLLPEEDRFSRELPDSAGGSKAAFAAGNSRCTSRDSC